MARKQKVTEQLAEVEKRVADAKATAVKSLKWSKEDCEAAFVRYNKETGNRGSTGYLAWKQSLGAEGAKVPAQGTIIRMLGEWPSARLAAPKPPKPAKEAKIKKAKKAKPEDAVQDPELEEDDFDELLGEDEDDEEEDDEA
jgi:hypothetical protein